MSLAFRFLGLIYAVGIGLGLWFLWPQTRGLLQGTWLSDLWLPALIIYALGGMWIAERIWAMIPPIFKSERS